MNEIAAWLYGNFATGYAPSWSTAPDKVSWRRVAVAVLSEFKEI